jgi:hypothetical protein
MTNVEIVQIRYIRPDGTLLAIWETTNQVGFTLPKMSDDGWLRIGQPPTSAAPPWVLQRREAGGEWETIDNSDDAIARRKAQP